MIALYIAGLIMVVLSSWVPGITSLTIILLFITMSSLWCLIMSIGINYSNEYNYQRIIYDKDNKIGQMGEVIHNLNNSLSAKDVCIHDLTYKLTDNYITNRKKNNIESEQTPNVDYIAIDDPYDLTDDDIQKGHKLIMRDLKLIASLKDNNSEKL